jgi:hypothetical protein
MKPCFAFLIAAFSVAAHAQAPVIATPASYTLLEAPHDDPTVWSTGQSERRHLQMQEQGLLIAKSVQARDKLAEDRDAARYADNRLRCATALRVAALCGKHAGTFYCDAKGFQPIPQAERKQPVFDNGARFRMERCAQEAASRPLAP